jgi:hypothetical protein
MKVYFLWIFCFLNVSFIIIGREVVELIFVFFCMCCSSSIIIITTISKIMGDVIMIDAIFI